MVGGSFPWSLLCVSFEYGFFAECQVLVFTVCFSFVCRFFYFFWMISELITGLLRLKQCKAEMNFR